jgi:thioredoxin reductase (NADPH)
VIVQEEHTYDIIVIGAGPAGASAALYAARADLQTLVLDKGLRTGAMGLASKIANYPGVPGEVSGAELLASIRDQARAFGAEFVQERVMGVDLRDAIKSVWGNQAFYRGRTVVIATGSMGRTRSVPGEERLLGAGVSYCATCDGAFFRDQTVAVVGSNDEAAEEALFLTRFARQVHLLVPTSELKAAPDVRQEVDEHEKITVYRSTRLTEIIGQQRVAGIQVHERGNGEQSLPVAGVFIYTQGSKPITGFLEGQLETTEEGCLIVDPGTMETAIAGVFAIGDVLCMHVKQAVISAAEGAIAAIAAQRYLSGREQLRPDWS